MTYEELKEFIRDNVVIEVEMDRYSRSNSMYISLRFKDDDGPFSLDHLYLPDKD